MKSFLPFVFCLQHSIMLLGPTFVSSLQPYPRQFDAATPRKGDPIYYGNFTIVLPRS